ncbi:hypothetical protein LJR034_007538 [Caballeronia sp. LjRoot34]|uniref:hypothetical protein n=1 Tax=Caballeronia sp. LjRoot34 TaxID=3342325 RepID=UPI003ECD8B40
MPRRANPPAIAKRLHYIIESVTGSERRDDCYISTYLGHLENFAAVTRERAWTAEKVKEHVAIVYTWIKRREHHYVVDMEVAEKFAAALNCGSNEHLLLNLAWSLVNNSMMAGAKFLHFYRPERFPITDSWLCDWVSGTPSQGYGLDFYREWLGGVHLVDEDHAESALAWARATFGYEVTRTRAIEAMAFYYVKSLSESDRYALWDFLSGTFPANDEAA